jgi:cell surface protein SprA
MGNANQKKSSCTALFAALFFSIVPMHLHAQLGLKYPKSSMDDIYLQLTKKKTAISLNNYLSEYPVLYPKRAIRQIVIDSTGQFVTLTYQLEGMHFFLPQRWHLKDYIALRTRIENELHWRTYAAQHILPSDASQQKRRGITLESPKIRSEAFRRIFGGETLSLNVTGNITIDGSMRNEKREWVQSATNRAPSTSFQMKQTQRFKVEGKIGENVSVMVDQDSERPFEFENALKIKYTGDEDGIVQSIEAGNVALSLPSTQFVTLNAQNKGLFGFKTHLKIGNLDLTAIASMEKGEKKKLTITGGKESGKYQIYDYQYKRFTYFFLDTVYRNKFDSLDATGNHIYNPNLVIGDIEVFKSAPGYINNQNAFEAWALLDPDNPDYSQTNRSESSKGFFLRQEPNKDYYVDKNLGFIRMEMALQESEVLAVAYRIQNSGREIGTLPDASGSFTSIDTVKFKMIKPESPRPTDKVWNLEWKNVYNLGGRNLKMDDLDVKIFYYIARPEEETITLPSGEKGYLEVFGLDKKKTSGAAGADLIIDYNENNLDLIRGELIFPDLKPFYPGDTTTAMLPMDRWCDFYDIESTNQQKITEESKFYIQVSSSELSMTTRNPNFSLGMNVIPGSEEVLLNGTALRKDEHYQIDYFTGQLTILHDPALNPDANLEINYESQQMFTIDKKYLLGARAEYTLWEKDNQRSFIGGTALYMNQKTLDQRIRVGKDGPNENFVWGVNTALNFKPQFLTAFLDKLPVLRVSGPSTVALEGEIAQVIPNPNTLNNEKTGDPDGVAYLDDFESARQITSISILRQGWNPASLPFINDSTKSDLSHMGYGIWYNPLGQVPIKDIWPEREVTSNYGERTHTHVLDLKHKPVPSDTLADRLSSWSGIQRALSSGYYNQTESRFLEVMVNGTVGKLHIDLGRISEDVIPNNMLDTEDQFINGIQNGQLDDGEDTGIDGIEGSDPPSQFYPHEAATIDASTGMATPYDFWDLNSDNLKDPNEPWSYDNWSYQNNSTNYDRINGTEDNMNDGQLRYPDTEDLNRNGNVDLNNDFYSFSFMLDKTHADTIYIAGQKNNEKGWRLYRIPLDEPDNIVGNPDWSRIEAVRIWIDSVGVDSSFTSIVEINLVGNEWKFHGIQSHPDSAFTQVEDSTLTISVVNTHDNSDEYIPPKGVEGDEDPVTKLIQKEQSLALVLNDLESEYTAVARKQILDKNGKNLINYKRLKMFVNGGGSQSVTFPADSSIEFFLRLGSDRNDAEYYEFRLPVSPGWSENQIDIDFETLSRLKLKMQASNRDTIDEMQSNGHNIRIVGNPSLTNIFWMMTGVYNKGPQPFSGTIWLDELRVSGVNKDKGVAMRARANIVIGDFMTLSGQYQRRDADFHTVNERWGGGSNSESYSVSTSMKLEKMLPQNWGLSVPISASLTKSIQTPKYIPGSDILVNENTVSDSLKKTIQTLSTSKGFNASINKTTNSRNFWVRHLVDPLKASVNYKTSESSNPTTLSNESNLLKGNVSYNLNLGQDKFLEPFKWMGAKGLFKKISKTRFYYLPTNISLTFDGNKTITNSETRSGVVSNVEKKTYVQTYATGMKPLNNVSMNYQRTSTRDLSNDENGFNALIKDFFNPGDLISVSQNLDANISPQLFSWFNPSFKYGVQYKYSNNIQQIATGANQSAQYNQNINISGTLNPKKLISSFSKKKTQKQSPSRKPVARRRPGPATQQPEEQKQEPEKEKKDEKQPFPLLSLVSTLGKTLEQIQPISVTFTRNETQNNNGILEKPGFAYQFGFISRDNLEKMEHSENVSNPETRNLNTSLMLRSGLRVSSSINLSMDWKTSKQNNVSTLNSGSKSVTVFWIKENKTLPLPNWTLQWSGLEKLPLLSKVTKTVSLNHGFSGDKKENQTNNKTTLETYTRNFSPLVGLSITFVNNIRSNVTYSKDETFELQIQTIESRKKIKSTRISGTASYSLKSGIKLPFLKKKLENTIDISITFESSKTQTYLSKEKDFPEDPSTWNKRWSFKPNVSYTFSKMVRGGLYLELGKSENSSTGDTKLTAFGLNAAITL